MSTVRLDILSKAFAASIINYGAVTFYCSILFPKYLFQGIIYKYKYI